MKYFILLFVIFSCSTHDLQKWNSLENFRMISQENIANDELDNIDDEMGPRVNALIDNQQALQARHDMWTNPNANFIYFSTYEFAEDEVGLAQIKWAVDAAKNGKQVNIVIDSTGHSLSDEIILYMVENGVNVHEWSPGFSLRGIKNRYRNNYPLYGPFAIFVALFKQTSYRMHDKIFYSDAISDDSVKLLGDDEFAGQLVLGGRNSVSSHFGLNLQTIRNTVTDTVNENGNIVEKSIITENVKREIEHEVLVHSPTAQRQAKAYIDDLLESRYTERLTVQALRKRLQKSRKKRTALGTKWKIRYAEEALKHDEEFQKFSVDIFKLLKKYEHGSNKARTQLAEELAEIFNRHSSLLAGLIKDEKLSASFFADNFKHFIPKEFHRNLKRQVKELSKGKITPDDFMEEVKLTIAANKEYLQVVFASKTLSPKFQQLIGPYKYVYDGSLPKLNGIIQGVWSKFKTSWFGIDMDIEKYENIESILKKNMDYLTRTFVNPNSKINWVRRAIPVDSVDFIHDTVDDRYMKKKVMNVAWDIISSSSGEIYFNSQYGSPPPEAMNAFDNFLKKNSVAYRLAQQELNKPGVGVNEDATRRFIDMLVQIIDANESNIALSLRGADDFGVPNRNREKANDAYFKHFFKELSYITSGDSRRKIKEIRKDFLEKNLSPDEASRAIVDVISSSTEDISEAIMRSKDRFQLGLERLRGFVDSDPNELLGPYKENKLFFMTNDKESWAVKYDDLVHDDFHLSMESKFSKLGRGLRVLGYRLGGRIHSKVLATRNRLLVWSANLDYRSARKNTEVGADIKTEKKGKKLNMMFNASLQGYMEAGTRYIEDGRFVRQTSCIGAIRTFKIKAIRSQL